MLSLTGSIIAMISIPEIGLIISVAVILFGFTAILQNPMLTKGQKVVWFATVLVLNWIGLLFYYYTFYMKNQK